MNNNRYIHKQGRYFSPAILFFAFCAFAFPIYIFFYFQDASFLFLSPIAALFFVPSQSFEVDFSNKQCRDCTRFFRSEWGEWESLAHIKHITVKTQTMKLTYEEDERRIEKYIVYFYSQDRQNIEVDEFYELDKAFDIAFKISNGLGIKVWDATSRPGRYIVA
ncbi:MAG: hypothetical protein ACPG4Z_02845 [Chitinophagales bacterium]